MKNILYIILISFFSLTIISCAKKSSNDNTTTTLSAPSGLTATGGASQVTLDWTAVSEASSYTVYWDNAMGVSSSSTAITGITGDNYTHTGLDNGTTYNSTTYFYKVAAVNSAGTGSLSSEVWTTTEATFDGTASSPVELTVGTAKSGGIAKNGYSYYKFTTASTGAGSYKLAIASLAISDSYYSSASVYTQLYSNSGYTSSGWIDAESCLASCNLVFNYENLDASKTYYLKLYGYGAVTYSLTISQGGSEGSKNNPVELTLGAAHTGGKVEGYDYYSYNRGNSYYKFTTTTADNYTLSMNNSDSLDCDLYSDSAFSSLVSNTHNVCTAGTNLSTTFKGSKGTGLSASTTYYLEIEQQASTATTTTYDNMTVAAEG